MKLLDLIFRNTPIDYPVDTTRGSVTKYLLPPYLRPPHSQRSTAGKIIYKEPIKKRKSITKNNPLEIDLKNVLDRQFPSERRRSRKSVSHFRVATLFDKRKETAIKRQSIILNKTV